MFGLEADWVAAWFRDALAVSHFDEVVFALPDLFNLEVFQEVFEEPPEPLDEKLWRSVTAPAEPPDALEEPPEEPPEPPVEKL